MLRPPECERLMLPKLLKREGPAVQGLLAIFLILQIIIRPTGEFPLNDDWAYAHSAIWFNTEHRIRLSNWIAMTLLPQTLAGGLVTRWFGFSFENLRHLTQIVACLTLFSAYGFFRVIPLARLNAFIATLVLMAMPSWLVLANSYMSDLYAFVFAFPAAAFFVLYMRTDARKFLVWATVFAAMGTLQRQVVLVIPFAFLLAQIWSLQPSSWRKNLEACMPFAFALGAFLAYSLYLSANGGVPDSQQKAHTRLWPLLLSELRGDPGMRAYFWANISSVFGYLGLFLFGWLLWWGTPRLSTRLRVVLAVATGAILAVSFAVNWLPPYQLNNTIDAAGIGPFTLYDVMSHPTFEPARHGGIVWPLAAVAAGCGTVGISALFCAVMAAIFKQRRAVDRENLFLTLVVMGYLAPFVIAGYFDRYLIFVLPFVIALWVRIWPISALVPSHLRGEVAVFLKGGALIWLAFAIGLGAAATHDYFEWNRARWQAIRHAETLGANHQKIDGGFEYNGFYSHETKKTPQGLNKSWWWVEDDLYVIAFSHVNGYSVVATYPVNGWISRTPKQVLLLRRTSP